MADSVVDNMFDLTNRYQTASTDFDPTVNRGKLREEEEKNRDKSTLTFTDLLGLMVAQFQNQSIDNQADTSDMMNQLVQMSVMQAMNEMTAQLKEVALASVMGYSASLVGQYVTLGVYNSEGELTEKYGKVEAAGTYNGSQVVFVDGESYFLSSIMAVGKLPEKVEEKPGEDGEEKPGEDGEEEAAPPAGEEDNDNSKG